MLGFQAVLLNQAWGRLGVFVAKRIWGFIYLKSANNKYSRALINAKVSTG
jgi:prolipoprotein diacylglyceryltransferase